jgi:hypothetical protein
MGVRSSALWVLLVVMGNAVSRVAVILQHEEKDLARRG